MTSRPSSSYSQRARLGLIVPPTNSVNEAEWTRLMPEGVTFHSHRMKLHPAGDPALMPDLLAGIELLGQVRPDAVAYACTAGSMTTPSAQMPDAASEASKGKAKIGSTLKGIGPTYMDKTGRNGMRVGDLEFDDWKTK